jgi:hypothetical protein
VLRHETRSCKYKGIQFMGLNLGLKETLLPALVTADSEVHRRQKSTTA